MLGSRTLEVDYSNRVAIVIPSLGQHMYLLERAVKSVQSQQHKPLILLVFPRSENHLIDFCQSRELQYILDDGQGFMKAYNQAIQHLKKLGIEIFGSIGDDDELLQGAIAGLVTAFDQESVVASVGHCWYINSEGKVIFHNKSRTWILPLMHFLPDLMPAPGALFTISAWEKVGGFSTEYRFASDYDFWLKIRKKGKVKRVEVPMSLFRWHSGGLTGNNRRNARMEAKIIRRNHSSLLVRPILVASELMFNALGEFVLKNSMKKDYRI